MTPTAAVPQRLIHPPDHEPAPGWGQSLSQGAPGIALLHIEGARTGTGGWPTVHAWAAAAARTPVDANPSSSPFHGAPAVAFALHTADHPTYAGALAALDQSIVTLVRHRLDHAHTRIDHRDLPALAEYDLISGLTGIGAYLLHRHPDGTTLRDVLGYLVRLTEPLHVNGETLPGWWSGHDLTDHPSPDWPGGHGNLGLAHGISGPLALLALAMRRGITVSGHTEALIRIYSWMDPWRQGSGADAWWPPWITRDENRAGRCAQAGPFRPSWCYGTPGIARALQLTGIVLGDISRQGQAEAALLGCVTDERQLAQITDASLCHGWAGLVHTVGRAATDARTVDLAAHLPRLVAQLTDTKPPDGLGFLEGAAGVELAMRTATTGVPPACGWDACLLIG